MCAAKLYRYLRHENGICLLTRLRQEMFFCAPALFWAIKQSCLARIHNPNSSSVADELRWLEARLRLVGKERSIEGSAAVLSSRTFVFPRAAYACVLILIVQFLTEGYNKVLPICFRWSKMSSDDIMQYDLTRVALGSVSKLKPQAGRSQQLPPYCSPRHPTALFTQCSIRSLVAPMFLQAYIVQLICESSWEFAKLCM